MTYALGILLVLIGLLAGTVVLHPQWREGLIVRCGLVLITFGSFAIGVQLLGGDDVSARAMVHGWFTQASGVLVVLVGWLIRVRLRRNPQRRATDWGDFDERPHHHHPQRAQ
jgi:hypothetical protein